MLPVWVWTQAGIGMNTSHGLLIACDRFWPQPQSSHPTDPGAVSHNGTMASFAVVSGVTAGSTISYGSHVPSWSSARIVNWTGFTRSQMFAVWGNVIGRAPPGIPTSSPTTAIASASVVSWSTPMTDISRVSKVSDVLAFTPWAPVGMPTPRSAVQVPTGAAGIRTSPL